MVKSALRKGKVIPCLGPSYFWHYYRAILRHLFFEESFSDISKGYFVAAFCLFRKLFHKKMLKKTLNGVLFNDLK